MKALRFHGAKDLRLDDVPIPALQDGYVKVSPSCIASDGVVTSAAQTCLDRNMWNRYASPTRCELVSP
jgi:hypothetical protein